VNEYEILLLLDPELDDDRQGEVVARARELVERGGGTWDLHDVLGAAQARLRDRTTRGRGATTCSTSPATRAHSTRCRACFASTTRACATWRHVGSKGVPFGR
jgi:hypothetical protein